MSAAIERAMSRLDRALGASKMLCDQASCEPYARDESEAEGVVPPCVVLAATAADIATTLAVCDDERVPVFPRGGGTGRTGGAVPMVPGVVIDTLAMNQVKDIDRANLTVTVEPGVLTGALQSRVEREGLFLPPDPQSAEWCCLGGNVAENAGGPRAFKYGVTRDYVLGIECALMGGATVRAGRRTAKGVAGYDVTALLVGSEGTLGVFTELTLKVIPLPREVRTLVAGFADVYAAGRAVAEIVARGITPRCIELLDDVCCAVMRAGDPSVLPVGANAVLLIECDGQHPGAVDEEMQRAGDACADAGAVTTKTARSADEREALWSVRKVMSRALRARAKNKLSEDVVVPRPRVPELLREVRAISEREGVVMPTYGHAGDGNLHVNLLWNDPSERAAVHRAIESLFRATLALGGTLTGEHGIGVLKLPYLPWEQSPELIDLQRRVKGAFDPHGLLNPGKIFTPGGPVSHQGC